VVCDAVKKPARGRDWTGAKQGRVGGKRVCVAGTDLLSVRKVYPTLAQFAILENDVRARRR